MRIACVDKTAADRLRLERFLDDAFRECRKSVGHMAVARFFPASKEELLINSCPEVAIVGSSLGCDEALFFARDVASVHSDLPLFVFLDPSEYTVKNIKRLEPYVTDVFSSADAPSRFVYALTTVSQKEKASSRGLLFAVQGVKGGVGTTSIAGAVAHAAQSLGRTVALVDLSQRGELLQFFLSDRWQSSEYSNLLTDKIIPEVEHLNRILVHARNGLPILPPPAGAGEMRELWLRDATRFEVPLGMIDLLQERFDLVVVDFAGSEGILPFAIECRADVRIFVSANEPGSLHLLTSRVEEFEFAGEGVTRFLVNRTNPHGLTHEDVLDFICWSSKFSEDMLYPLEVPYDARGGLWVGTGNSLYTEGGAKLRSAIESFTRDALGMDEAKSKKIRIPFANSLKNLAERALPEKRKKEVRYTAADALPFLAGAAREAVNSPAVNSPAVNFPAVNFPENGLGESSLASKKVLKQKQAMRDIKSGPTLFLPTGSQSPGHGSETDNGVVKKDWSVKVSDSLAGERVSTDTDSGSGDLGFVYEPPKLRANE
ncbi:MAG TPA: ParA family protein [Oligoflexia bacterium]|nr:ParA family protein [Oligoflexia bacterium]HMP48277.1 ParA family protein [Oligoflexia bacterium]